jgi:BirA family biotin operon repressor/biotin-[acetyl-CoA-carboxylase] ligase
VVRQGGWAGRDAAALVTLLGVPRVEVRARVDSTMDVAHGLGREGAPAGTLVIAEQQNRGRGRSGRAWQSDERAGIWMTLLERPSDVAALEVLSLRLGLAAARVLDRFAGQLVRLKWPNDLYLGDGKLAGILVETRWREGRADWVAIGVGVNTRVPSGVAEAVALPEGTDRLEVLSDLVPSLRAAAAARGTLQASELAAFQARDLALGRRCVQPADGIVRGVSMTGELVVETTLGERAFRGGSLVFHGAEP